MCLVFDRCCLRWLNSAQEMLRSGCYRKSLYCRLSLILVGVLSDLRMGCKGFLECLLKLLNFLLTLLGLAMVGYGVYLFIMYRNATDDMDAVPLNEGLIQLGRPMLMAVSLSSNNIFDNLPTAWFIYLFIGVGAIVFVISCFGCIGTKAAQFAPFNYPFVTIKATIRSKLQKESNTSLLQVVIFVFSCWSQSFLLFLSQFIIFVVCHITKNSFTWLITGAYITIESIV